jgi:hypothetical protein
MDKKKEYLQPQVKMVAMRIRPTLLAGSLSVNSSAIDDGDAVLSPRYFIDDDDE